MRIEIIELEKLVLDSSNARSHSEKNIRALSKSLEQFGQRKPIVIDAENLIVAGNGTVQAARYLGWRTIEIVRVPKEWSAEQIKAFALADNRTAELSEWNKDILAEQLFELQEANFDPEILGFDPPPVADFLPVDEDVNPSLDKRARHECPNCGEEFEMKSGNPIAIK